LRQLLLSLMIVALLALPLSQGAEPRVATASYVAGNTDNCVMARADDALYAALFGNDDPGSHLPVVPTTDFLADGSACFPLQPGETRVSISVVDDHGPSGAFRYSFETPRGTTSRIVCGTGADVAIPEDATALHVVVYFLPVGCGGMPGTTGEVAAAFT
jgi:hypothetical protein